MSGDKLAAARALLERHGFAPLPLYGVGPDGRTCHCPRGARCTSAGKHPIQANWTSAPKPTLDDLDDLWRRYPTANVGIRTGAISGVFVADVDLWEAWAPLIEQHGEPITLTIQTGSGGRHYYFLLPAGVTITNSRGSLPAGIDVRGDGGQVVAPPSRTGKGDYTVIRAMPPQPAPQWLLDMISAGRPVSAAAAAPVVSADLTEAQAAWHTEYARGVIETRLCELDALAALPWEDRPAGWDETTHAAACRILDLLQTPGVDLDLATVKADFLARAPRDDQWQDGPEQKWSAALRSVSGAGTTIPPKRATVADLSPAGTPSASATPQSQPAAIDGEPADPLALLIDQEVGRLRVRAAARRIFDAENQPPAEPFDAGTLGEVLARPEEPAMRVDGLIPWEASTLLTAIRKAGKTTGTLNLARCLITGEPFLGRFAVRPVEGKVAILNYEVSARQVARWADEHGIDRSRLVLVNLRGRRNPLADPEDRARLAAYLRSHDVETLIVDPFGRAYTGLSQDNNGEVGAWLADLDRFARAEVGALDVILTNHAGWGGERSRGASALEDWPDSILTMTRDEDSGDRYLKAQGRDVEVDEDRLAFDLARRLLTLDGSGSRRQRRQEGKVADLAVLALAAIRKEPGASARRVEELVRDFDDSPSFAAGDLRAALRREAGHGRIRIEPGPKRSNLHYLTEAAK